MVAMARTEFKGGRVDGSVFRDEKAVVSGEQLGYELDKCTYYIQVY